MKKIDTTSFLLGAQLGAAVFFVVAVMIDWKPKTSAVPLVVHARTNTWDIPTGTKQIHVVTWSSGGGGGSGNMERKAVIATK